MSLTKIKFEDKEVSKKEFYSSKQAISLDYIDLDKIVVSNKHKINDKRYIYICVVTLFNHYVLLYLK